MTTNPTAPQDGGENLAPCPLCGGRAELWKAHPDRPARKAWIACVGRCCILTREYMSDAEAIAAWNTRGTLDIATVRNAALEEAAQAVIEYCRERNASEKFASFVHAVARIRALQQKGPTNV